MALGPVAHGELDAEIGCEADEEHPKGDRDQVECANHQQARGRSHDKADAQADKYGEVGVSRAQRQPENDQHREHRSGEIGQHPLAECHELLIVDRSLSGQPHPCAKHWAEFQLIRRLPDRVYRRAARLQGAEIEFWLDLDEAPRLVWCCGIAIHQHAPREAGKAAGEKVVQRAGEHVHRPGERIRRHAASLHRPDAERQSVHHATQARIPGEHLDHRFGRGEPARGVRHLIDGRKQQGAALQELAALRPADRRKAAITCPKFCRQPVGRHLHELRRRALHNNEDLILRERVPVRQLVLAPWQILWQELVGIGGDGEMRGRIKRRTDRQHRRNDDDWPWMARAEADHPQDRRCQHTFYSPCARAFPSDLLRIGTPANVRALILYRL